MTQEEARPKRFPARLEDALASTGRRVPGGSGARAIGAGLAAGARGQVSPPPEVDARRWQGGGTDAQGYRLRMVERLRQDGCVDEAVLAAMASVPRHRFVDSGLAEQAYEDTSLPIGWGQTISKPSVVARMISLLRGRPGGVQLHKVLEIGTGCGYQAAVLGQLARQVYSVERVRELFDKAREHLSDLRTDNLRLIYGDGRLGHGPNAPYDAIIAAAGGEDLPPAWLDQLAPGGRLVAPVEAGTGGQVLVIVDRHLDGSLHRRHEEAVRFVPLQSGVSFGG